MVKTEMKKTSARPQVKRGPSISVPCTPPPIPQDNQRKQTVLSEAQDLIFGDREKDYGAPKDNLAIVARLWETYLEARLANCGGAGTFHLTNKDVAMLLLLLKVARLSKSPNHRDSVIDAAGYIGLLERCDE